MPFVNPDLLKPYITNSIEAMIAHGISSLIGPPIPDQAIIEVCFQSAAESPTREGRVQLRIYSYRERTGAELLWEIIESKGQTRADQAELIQHLESLDLFCLEEPVEVVSTSEWNTPPAIPPMKPLWRFHPLRLAALMPWGSKIVQASKEPRGVMTEAAMKWVQNTFMEELNVVRRAYPARPRVEANPDQGRAQRQYLEMLMHAAGFFATGKQIFDFPSALSALFHNTDVDDIALEHVKLPYPVVYLHFGRQEDMPLGDGWFAEGAYLAELRTPTGDRYLNIVAVSGTPSLARYLNTDLGFEPSYTLALKPEHHTMALAEAVDLALADKIAFLKHEIEVEPLRAVFEEQVRRGEAPPGAVCVQARNAGQELAALMPRHESFTKLLRLAVNALVYINGYPDDIEAQWPPSTSPSKLRELAKAKDKKEKSRVLSELARAGFTPIHLCGKRLADELAKQGESLPAEGRTVALHWVRGHWRRQAHGPGRSLRKLIWRMPLLRGSRQADEAASEPQGHIYLVS